MYFNEKPIGQLRKIICTHKGIHPKPALGIM